MILADHAGKVRLPGAEDLPRETDKDEKR